MENDAIYKKGFLQIYNALEIWMVTDYIYEQKFYLVCGLCASGHLNVVEKANH